MTTQTVHHYSFLFVSNIQPGHTSHSLLWIITFDSQVICYYMNALFQKSIVMYLLTGTNKGIRSLLEESLLITREMLREAQLAYPRNTVRNYNLRENLFLMIPSLKLSSLWNSILCDWFSVKSYRNIVKWGFYVVIHLLMQVLQSLKSKMLDLARALQSYIHCHVTVSFSNLQQTRAKIARQVGGYIWRQNG